MQSPSRLYGPRFGRSLLLAALALGAAGCRTPAPPPWSGEIVDLTHAFGEDTIYWPTDVDGFVFEELSAGLTEQGYYYTANRFRTAEHGGTHIDAPLHFAVGAAAVDEIPLERLVGPAVVVDLVAAAEANADYEVTRDDFATWEAQHGPLPEGSIVLLRTGFGARWPDRASYLGTDRRGPSAIPELHFPGLHPDAARWLVAERSIGAIGLDTPSIDTGQSKLFESHRILFAHGIPAFENLAHLDSLPARGFYVVALPMKIRGGSGGPLRAIAIVPPGAEPELR